MEKIDNLLLFLEHRTEKLEHKNALGMKTYLGWREITFKGLSILAKRLAAYLIDKGIDKGDKIAILSESKPEWGATLFAAILSGATLVPLDIKLTEYELNSILSDCSPKILITSSTYLEKAKLLKTQIKSIEEVIVIDEGSTDAECPCMYNMPDVPDKKWRHRSPSKTAFIIYTSGTTGMPKGVEITYKNVIAQVESLNQCFKLGINDRLLSILPMNHLFELSVGFLNFLSMGTAIYYSKSLKPKDLFRVLSEKEITFMVVVPAFLKLLKTDIESGINQQGFFQKLLFKLKFEIAKLIPSMRIRKLLFPSIHKKFGGKFKGCISGGAPLDLEVGKFIETLGISILEGYGLSEASPVVSMNIKDAKKLGSVGKAIPGVQVKINSETGELMVKGDNVMKGYYNQPDLTKDVIEEDGWLHTGDIAKIDNEGFIYITGRIKNMIVLSGGKKVFPEEVEAVLAQSPIFQEVCVVGTKRSGGQKDGTEDISVVIVPTKDISNSTPNDSELLAKIRAEVKELSLKLSQFKRPTNIILSRDLLPRTATSKIKRKEVKKLVEK
ncbi:AMP-binding protein [bacterium]|nr:AMP-binding protein [bacterium]